MTTKQFVPRCLLAAASFCLLFAACDPLGTRGSGDLSTENRDEKNFHAIEVHVPGTVEVRTDSVYKVQVTCEESIIAYLETIEDNGVLKILFDRDVYDVDNLKILVSAPNWDRIEVNGSAKVDVPDAIKGLQLDLDVAGSGDLKVYQADFTNINTKVSGSGNITLSGAADQLNAVVNGSGDLFALNCPVKTATVTVSGSGNVQVSASESLQATISGSGDVSYKGNPQITKSISGSGRLKKID